MTTTPTILGVRRLSWLVAVLMLVAVAAATVLIGEGERDRLSTDNLPSGLDSTEATALLDRLPDADTEVALVLWTAREGRLSQEQLGALQQQSSELGGPPLTVSDDGTAALAVTSVPSTDQAEVSDGVGELRDRLAADAPDGVRAEVTGPAGIQADLSAVFDGANTRLLLATALVVAFLLIVTYRSPVLWLVPLTVVGLADRFAAVAATQVMAAVDVAWDESTVGILSVLVFGAGTDYALLLISRYRDELRHEDDRWVAMGRARRRTAEAVLSSATTVVLGLLTLLLSLTPTTRGLGLACAVGVVIAAAAVLLVLPSALVACGRWVFWPRVPRVGQTPIVETDTIWHRIGTRVARRPGAVVVAGALVLVAMAAGLFRVDLGLDQSEQFLDEPQAITAAQRLGESFPAGTSDPTQVVTTGDPAPVLAAVSDLPGVASARPGESGGGVSTVQVVLDGASGSAENSAAVERIRDAVADLPGTHVTGTEAQTVDGEDAAGRDLRLILPLILALVLVGLGVLLRSVVAPLLLVGTVVATYAAALGVAWWVFTGALGFSAIDSQVPLIAFLFLVALGVDYNIFLVTRAKEEAERHGTREGMLRALAATGGVITSAGILLAAVFLVLGVLPLVVLAQIGTVICIGVLLDTLLVRTVIVPALALRLGDRFWWPRRVG
jgi:RND superfamily putative drug exporter